MFYNVTLVNRTIVALLIATCVAASAGAATVTVNVGPGFTFSPNPVNINVGDTVQWNFLALHTSTSNTNTGPEVWDSGFKSSGTFSHTFMNPGNWPYYCSLHSTPTGTTMNAVVHVNTPAPTLVSVNPAAGPTAGGTAVTLSGTNFAAGCTVTFGGSGAAATFQNQNSMTATSPAHAAGTVAVAVTCPGGTATLNNAFTYANAPTITGVIPASSPPGLAVTITGTAFQPGATVTIGGIAATGVTVVNTSTMTATVPNLAPGAAPVVVTNPDLQSSTFNGFTVLSSTAIPALDPRAMWILAAALAALGLLALRARGL